MSIYRTRLQRFALTSLAVGILSLAPGLVHAAEVDTADLTQTTDTLAFGNSTKGTATIGLDQDAALVAFGKSSTGSIG